MPRVVGLFFILLSKYLTTFFVYNNIISAIYVGEWAFPHCQWASRGPTHKGVNDRCRATVSYFMVKCTSLQKMRLDHDIAHDRLWIEGVKINYGVVLCIHYNIIYSVKYALCAGWALVKFCRHEWWESACHGEYLCLDSRTEQKMAFERGIAKASSSKQGCDLCFT